MRAVGAPGELVVLSLPLPGSEVVHQQAAGHLEERGHRRGVGVVAPGRVVAAAPDRLDLAIVGVAQQVQVMDRLLIEHRLVHRQRVLVDARPTAVAVAPVDEAREAWRAEPFSDELFDGPGGVQVAKIHADRERFAGNIQRQTERLQQLIDRLLALADVEQLRQLRTVEPVDLAALTRELLHTAEPRLRRKGLRVQTTLDEGATVRGDRFLIAQALQNLLDNAIDFSPQGGALAVSARRADGLVEWSVRDEGPGVPDYAADRIFERFYSLPRADTQEKSSGLGLCLVKEVSELHGGTLRIENVDHPRGCRASWTLPA